MPISVWELVAFTEEELDQRLRTMTWQERETERLAEYENYLSTIPTNNSGETDNE